jgi:hypothetical protein
MMTVHEHFFVTYTHAHYYQSLHLYCWIVLASACIDLSVGITASDAYMDGEVSQNINIARRLDIMARGENAHGDDKYRLPCFAEGLLVML